MYLTFQVDPVDVAISRFKFSEHPSGVESPSTLLQAFGTLSLTLSQKTEPSDYHLSDTEGYIVCCDCSCSSGSEIQICDCLLRAKLQQKGVSSNDEGQSTPNSLASIDEVPKMSTTVNSSSIQTDTS